MRRRLVALATIVLVAASTVRAENQLPLMRQSTPIVQSQHLPSSPQYWDFQRWYLNHVVVTLFVSGADPQHLTTVLENASALRAKGVMLGPIVVIGGSHFAQLNASESPPPPPTQLPPQTAATKGAGKHPAKREAQQIQTLRTENDTIAAAARGLDLRFQEEVPDLTTVLGHLQAQYSPTWVVRLHGADYIYEGVDSITDQFDEGGQFHAPAQ